MREEKLRLESESRIAILILEARLAIRDSDSKPQFFFSHEELWSLKTIRPSGSDGSQNTFIASAQHWEERIYTSFGSSG
jgi:hypothetical protein